MLLLHLQPEVLLILIFRLYQALGQDSLLDNLDFDSEEPEPQPTEEGAFLEIAQALTQCMIYYNRSCVCHNEKTFSCLDLRLRSCRIEECSTCAKVNSRTAVYFNRMLSRNHKGCHCSCSKDGAHTNKTPIVECRRWCNGFADCPNAADEMSKPCRAKFFMNIAMVMSLAVAAMVILLFVMSKHGFLQKLYDNCTTPRRTTMHVVSYHPSNTYGRSVSFAGGTSPQSYHAPPNQHLLTSTDYAQRRITVCGTTRLNGYVRSDSPHLIYRDDLLD